MSAAFTPEQEASLREIADERIAATAARKTRHADWSDVTGLSYPVDGTSTRGTADRQRQRLLICEAAIATEGR